MPDANHQSLTPKLLATVAAVAAELHPGRAGPPPRLDSQLDRDLGFDSLGRVELVSRIEKTFSVALPERLAIEAETPRDLLRAIESAPRLDAPARREAAPAAHGPAAAREAHDAVTWIDVLEWHADRSPEAVCIRFYEDEQEGRVLSYGDLFAEATAIAAGLLERGLEPGQSVALMLPTGPQYFTAFYGVWLAGGVPVPIYPPFRPAQLEEHVRRQAGILTNSLAAMLVTTAELAVVARLLTGQVATLRAVVTPDDLAAGGGSPGRPSLAPADTALLQYTSGSTAAPKGVILSHANLLTNVRAMGAAVAVRPDDVVVSWLPLYHDMGLIGAWLGSLYHGMPLILMSPLAFISRPARWLRAIHRHRGTLTAAPNFAYELCVRRIDEAEAATLDLSSLRGIYNGAEPVNPDTLRAFETRFAKSGLRPEAMMPVYGLAENCVGLTFPPLGRGPLFDRVDRRTMINEGTAAPSDAPGTATMTFVSCGRPLPDHEIRVVDTADRELPDRREGRIQFRGPSATSGYFRNAEATAALFHDGWLDTGDLGYIADGELYVTGRVKDIIIKAGRNVHPEELEAAVGEVSGVRRGNVAVFGVADAGGEKLVVVAETRKTAGEERARIEQAIGALAIDLTGMPADHVVLAPPNSVPKTSSGKIRRAACRQMFEAGMIGRRRKQVWRQVAALRLAAARQELARMGRRAGEYAFAAYAWLVIGLLAPVGWLAAVLLPTLQWRWSAARAVLRTAAALTGTKLVGKGIETLPRTPAVLVANHASYLDGFVLIALLRRPVAFVAKAELQGNWATAMPLKRMGAVFVERFDRAQGMADAKGLLTRERPGNTPLLFFPEGTFTRRPGLLPFHMGAFVTAAAADLPVVPIAIRGTRSMLRAGSWFPRPGFPNVAVGNAVHAPAGEAWDKAVWLRNAAREQILRLNGEPDLAQERSPV
ncbi:MAG: AMP-binding protein [Rhodospirillales bacterium]|nr:AMP-binding protein [Rhodospirillales bacterium]